eukprot:scpid10192/ scgid18794/ 24-hydroxycholesterol 7-alpha-hydroxylase; Cytochrome P450 39A1; Oxysterol 7-alpha-hydroxylase
MELFVLLSLLALFLLSVLALTLGVRRGYSSSTSAPPCVSGWLPWIGCAVEFGKEPLLFLDATRKRLGDVFTIHAAGRRMTFLMDPDDTHIFMQSDALDFQKAVQPFTSKAAGLPAKSFTESHRALHDLVKGKLASGKLNHITRETLSLFEEKLHYYAQKYSLNQPSSQSAVPPGQAGMGDGSTSLYTLVQSVMFHSGVQSLFGQKCIDDAKDIDFFRETFERYDLDFEYGAELPPVFLPKWATCKTWLLKLLKGVIDQMQPQADSENKNLLEELMLNVDKYSAHNYGLLLLWATQANAIPAVFWTLAFLHQDDHRHHLERVRTEAHALFDGKGKSDFTEDDLKGLTYTLWCVLEGIRLRSPGMITRLSVKPLKVKNYVIPKGHYVMVSPFWLHRNEAKFPNSSDFMPERWQSTEIAKGGFLPGFTAFGGGRYQCPGRWFAMMEMQIIVALVVYHYDIELQTGVPGPSPLHLVGTQQPAAKCDVKIKRRIVA